MKRSVGRVTIASMNITLTSRNQGVQSQLNASPRLNRNKRETSTSGRLRGLRVSWVYALFSWNATESSHVVNISRLQLQAQVASISSSLFSTSVSSLLAVSPLLLSAASSPVKCPFFLWFHEVTADDQVEGIRSPFRATFSVEFLTEKGAMVASVPGETLVLLASPERPSSERESCGAI